MGRLHIPMGHFGEPGEIAKAAPSLASDAAAFVIAGTFLVDAASRPPI